MDHQCLQHGQILLRQRNGLEAGRQQATRSRFQYPAFIRFCVVEAARQGGNGSGQLVEIGRLGQIVICAILKAGNLVAHGATCRQDDDADPLSLTAQGPDQVHAVAVGQSEVDDGDPVPDRVVDALELGQAGHGIDPMADIGEELGEFLAQNGFVFEQDQVLHGNRVIEALREKTEAF